MQSEKDMCWAKAVAAAAMLSPGLRAEAESTFKSGATASSPATANLVNHAVTWTFSHANDTVMPNGLHTRRITCAAARL